MNDEKRNRKEEILKTASTYFAESGFRGATLSAIAEEVGLTVPGLLHYFPNKIALLQEVLNYRDQTDKARYETIEKEGQRSIFDALQDLVRANQNKPGLVQLFIVMVTESINPEHPSHKFFIQRYRDLRQVLNHYLQETIQVDIEKNKIKIDQLATMIIAMMDGLQIQWLLDPHGTDMVGAFGLFVSAMEFYLASLKQERDNLVMTNGDER